VDPLANLPTRRGTPLKKVQKVLIAEAVCAQPADLRVVDLRERVMEVARLIRESADAPLGEALVPEAVED
jgi:hypothetical protein